MAEGHWGSKQARGGARQQLRDIAFVSAAHQSPARSRLGSGVARRVAPWQCSCGLPRGGGAGRRAGRVRCTEGRVGEGRGEDRGRGEDEDRTRRETSQGGSGDIIRGGLEASGRGDHALRGARRGWGIVGKPSTLPSPTVEFLPESSVRYKVCGCELEVHRLDLHGIRRRHSERGVARKAKRQGGRTGASLRFSNWFQLIIEPVGMVHLSLASSFTTRER